MRLRGHFGFGLEYWVERLTWRLVAVALVREDQRVSSTRCHPIYENAGFGMNNKNDREEQFLQVFVRYEDDLKAYARALVPTWEAVDNVMQEASLVIWRKMDQLGDPSEFVPWAKVIVRYECLKARRTAAMDRHCFSTEVLELLADQDAAYDEDKMALERVALNQCLGGLGAAQKELVLLLYRDHGGVASLAAKSGRTVNSFYKQIRRLRQKLTRCVGRKLADPTFIGEVA